MIAGRGPTVPGTWYLVQSQISPSSTLYVVPGTWYRYPVGLGPGQGHVAVAASANPTTVGLRIYGRAYQVPGSSPTSRKKNFNGSIPGTERYV